MSPRGVFGGVQSSWSIGGWGGGSPRTSIERRVSLPPNSSKSLGFSNAQLLLGLIRFFYIQLLLGLRVLQHPTPILGREVFLRPFLVGFRVCKHPVPV